MSAGEFFKAGHLQQAIDAQIKEVKAHPADQGKRLFLFELFAFAGDLDRARRQIDAVKYEEPEIDARVQAYRHLVDAELARRRLFREGLQPQFLVPPPEHVRLRLEAVNRLRENQPAEAAELLARAASASPPLKGMLNDRPFDSLRDGDDLFGPVLEALAHGAYYWVPLEQVDTLALNPPSFPRDLLWAPARLQIREGPAGEVFLPVLYPGSHEQPDEAIKLGRMTDWKPAPEGPVLGVGLRSFLVGDEAISLLEWRQLQIL